MALRNAGKAAWWSAGRKPTAYAAGALFGVAAVAGAGSAVMDSQGPYGDLQELHFGDRDAIRYSMKAGLKTAFDPANDHDINRPLDYYYGRPVNVPGIQRRRSSGSATPVSGDTVFGMYNLRR